jgi:hypothetical protein
VSRFIVVILSLAAPTFLFAAPKALTESPPRIVDLLKPAIYKKVLGERDIEVHASLDDLTDSKSPQSVMKKYSIYAAMFVDSNVKHTHAVLTNYALYPQMISYVDRADYDATTHVLTIQGGIWHYVLRSRVKFDERSEGWIHFTVIQGDFFGLQGDMYLEQIEAGPKGLGTLAYLHGEVTGAKWPPALIIEKGAEIVFGFTAQHMRSYIEK